MNSKDLQPKDYNLQPYDSTGDTKGYRKIDWFVNYVLPLAKQHSGGRAIDLGCGNGRLNSIFKDLFEEILCVDPFCELDKRFVFDNIKYKKSHLHDLKVDSKYDAILMMGSFHIIYLKYDTQVFDYCHKLLKKGGNLIAMWDEKQSKLFDLDTELFKIQSKITTKDKTSNVVVLEKI